MNLINKLRNNKKKIFLLFLFLIFFWVWKDYKKIDIFFLNQSFVTYDIKNVNSITIRKIDKLYNRALENILVKYFDKHKNYWNSNNDERDKLPEYKFLKNKKEFTKNIDNNPINLSNWERSHGNNSSNRFSNLKKINNNNASNLEIAWIFEMENYKGDIQANPIIVDGIIYTPIAGGYIVALDGKSGNLIWKSKKFGNSVARRGLLYHKDSNDKIARIIFSNTVRFVNSCAI